VFAELDGVHPDGVKSVHVIVVLLAAVSCATTTTPPPRPLTQTQKRVAFHVECLAELDSHHCTTWARDPGCGALTCPLVACRYLERISADEPSLLVPYLRDRRAVVRNWVRLELFLEYGDNHLSDFEVKDDDVANPTARDRREAFIEKWERFAAGKGGFPRRSPSAPVEHGTIPHCWPSLRPPPWWPEDEQDWPAVHPAPTCCEGGSVVPGGGTTKFELH